MAEAQDGNAALGRGAIWYLTTGDFNVGVGDSAITNIDRASKVVAIGAKAGPKVDGTPTIDGNIYIGSRAGNADNSVAFDVVLIGEESGVNNSGGDNTFVGTKSGWSNTSGTDNTFIGEEAGRDNVIGRNNVYVGEDAGYGVLTSDNTFVGRTAGRGSGGTGEKNTGIGNESLYDIRDGRCNTALGDSSATDIGNGSYNTMLGQAAGAATEYASFNTFVGWNAGWDNNRTNSTTNANRNTYLGARTGFANREGEDNVGVGAFADYNNNVRSQTTFVGASANPDNNFVTLLGYDTRASGAYGTAVGHNAISSSQRAIAFGPAAIVNTGASDAVAIGETASVGANASQSIAIGPDASIAADATNSIAIGAGATVTASHEVYIGNAATATIGGVANWTATSDARLKTDVTADVPGLSFVRRLRPVRYRFDAEGLRTVTTDPALADAIIAKSAAWQTGFLAQEVEAAAEVENFEFSGVVRPENGRTQYGLRYAEFVVPLTRAIQELDERTAELDARSAELDARAASLNARDAEFEARISLLEAMVSGRSERSSAQRTALSVPSEQNVNKGTRR